MELLAPPYQGGVGGGGCVVLLYEIGITSLIVRTKSPQFDRSDEESASLPKTWV
jgi:hypothetical protein